MGRVTRNTVLAITFIVTALLLLGGLAWYQASQGGPVTWRFWALCCVCAVLVIINLVQTDSSSEPEPEPPKDARLPAAPADVPKRPRARLKRIARRTVPPLSGTSTALIVGSCLLLSTILVPLGLRKSVWVELEIVLAAWWAIGVVTLAVLLFKGRRVDDDKWGWGWPWYRREPKKSKAKTAGDQRERVGCAEAAGCLDPFTWLFAPEFFILGALLAVAFGAAWLLVEALLPAVFLVVYYLVVQGFGRALRDRHDCKGKLGRSAFWGAVWSTVYVASLIVLVWLIGLARGM